jgi:hypothetical protein
LPLCRQRDGCRGNGEVLEDLVIILFVVVLNLLIIGCTAGLVLMPNIGKIVTNSFFFVREKNLLGIKTN